MKDEPPSTLVAFLPNAADDELILPSKLAELVRALRVTGYDDCLFSHGFPPDGHPIPKISN